MRNAVRFVLAVFLVMTPNLLLAQVADGLKTPTSQIEKELKIMTFGDSLMSGYGVSEYRDFGGVLQRKLHKDKHRDLWVFNQSEDGRTTEKGLKDLDKLISSKPDIVLLGLGINDVYQVVPLQDTYNNLSKIITTLQEENIKILLIGVKAPASAGEEYVKQFDGMYKYLAKQYNLPFYPYLLDGVDEDSSLKLEDGLHPNQTGIEVMVDRVAPLVVKMLKKES